MAIVISQARDNAIWTRVAMVELVRCVSLGCILKIEKNRLF